MFRINKVFKKTKYITVQKDEIENIQSPEAKVMSKEKKTTDIKPNIPNGLWIKCADCGEVLYKKDFDVDKKICVNCGKHYRMGARDRISSIIDEGTFKELDKNMKTVNPLDFKGYEDKVDKYKKKSKLEEAVVTGYGKINDNETVIGVMDSNFMMGSMGSVLGEKVTRAIEYATKHRLPIMLFTASGGARMQEGLFSLMQMAKTSAAIAKHGEAGLLYITVLTDPTTGGVTASFAMLGDIILSEPCALIGFAGKRVIEQTIKQKLPEGFQTAEFLLERGFIDKIVPRTEMKETLASIIEIHQ